MPQSRTASIFRRRPEDDMEAQDAAAMGQSSPAQTVFGSRDFESYSGNGAPGQAEQRYSQELQKPEPEYRRPQQATGLKKIFGNILASTQGFGQIGDRIVHGDVPEAQEDFALAKDKRARTLTHMGQAANEEEAQGKRMYDIFRGERSAEDTNRHMQSQIRREESETNYRRAQIERIQHPLTRSMQPGSAIFDPLSGKQTNPGNPDTYGRSRTSMPFDTVRTAEGIFSHNRSTGQKGERLGGLAPVQGPGGGGGAGGVAQARIVESKKQDRLENWKKSYMKQRQALDADYSKSPQEKAATLEQLNKQDASQKQGIQNAYEAELERLGIGGEHFDYDPTTEGMGDQIDAVDNEQTVKHGTIAEDPRTGERIRWDEDAQEWQPVDQR